MWIFGYGSLMWDGWEKDYFCLRKVQADLQGYGRIFNKSSTKNWGSKTAPGPTLNLHKAEQLSCSGIAFEFSDLDKALILAYLEKREGKGFSLTPFLVRLEDGSEVEAHVPIYAGPNIIEQKSLDEIAGMVMVASGSSGTCLEYVASISSQLVALEIEDAAVQALWKKLQGLKQISA
jgi:cation transport protein ChaC